jgi:hypothetical protein
MNTNKPSKSGKYLDADTWDAMKAAGFTEAELEQDQPEGPVIFAYTRKQAIEDGVLIDVTPLARRAGFKVHTAITCGVSGAITELVRRRRPEDFEKYPLYRIQEAAYMAMLVTLREEIDQQTKTGDRLDFQCGDVNLWSHIGPGDEGEPVLTVMLPEED